MDFRDAPKGWNAAYDRGWRRANAQQALSIMDRAEREGKPLDLKRIRKLLESASQEFLMPPVIGWDCDVYPDGSLFLCNGDVCSNEAERDDDLTQPVNSLTYWRRIGEPCARCERVLDRYGEWQIPAPYRLGDI